MKENIIPTEFDEELILYDTERDEVHVLNSTARLIYKLLEEGKSPSQIEQIVAASFEKATGQSVRQDIDDCLEELRKKGIVDAS